MTDLIINIIELYTYVLLVRVLFSWLPPESKNNQFYHYLYAITEPALRPVREVLPRMSGFDFSPLIVFFLLQFIISLLR